MVLVGDLGAGAAVGEELSPIQIVQEPASVCKSADLLGNVRCQPRQERSGEQDLPVLRRCLVEDLAGEIVEHRFAAFGFDVLRRSSTAVDALEHQRQSRGPTTTLSVEHVDQRCVQWTHGGCNAARLFLCEPQLVPTDPRHRLVRDEPGVQAGRFAPAHDHDVDALGNFLRRIDQQSMECDLAEHLIVIVQRQHGRARQARVQLAKEAAAEAGEIAEIFWRQQGQRLVLGRERSAGGEAQVIEECRGVSVAAVDVIPQAAQPSAFQVTRDQRGLACSGRPVHPDQRMRALPVEQREQSLAWQRAEQPGPAELGQPSRRCGSSRCIHHDAWAMWKRRRAAAASWSFDTATGLRPSSRTRWNVATPKTAQTTRL